MHWDPANLFGEYVLYMAQGQTALQAIWPFALFVRLRRDQALGRIINNTGSEQIKALMGLGL